MGTKIPKVSKADYEEMIQDLDENIKILNSEFSNEISETNELSKYAYAKITDKSKVLNFLVILKINFAFFLDFSQIK